MVNLDPRRPDAPPAPATPRGRSGPRSRDRAASPGARVTPGPVAVTSQRNPVWLLAGVLLVLISAVGGMLVFRAGDERQEVLVAARDLAAGDVVGRDDFRIRRMATDGLEVIEPEGVAAVVGQRAVGPVPAGALVHPAMFGASEPIGPDEMDVGAALEPGAFPRRDVALGTSAELLVVIDPALAEAAVAVTAPDPSARPVGGADGVGDGAGLPAAVPIGRGTIVAVEERATGQLLVTVRVERSIGLYASQAAAEGRLRLALVAGPEDADG